MLTVGYGDISPTNAVEICTVLLIEIFGKNLYFISKASRYSLTLSTKWVKYYHQCESNPKPYKKIFPH